MVIVKDTANIPSQNNSLHLDIYFPNGESFRMHNTSQVSPFPWAQVISLSTLSLCTCWLPSHSYHQSVFYSHRFQVPLSVHFFSYLSLPLSPYVVVLFVSLLIMICIHVMYWVTFIPLLLRNHTHISYPVCRQFCPDYISVFNFLHSLSRLMSFILIHKCSLFVLCLVAIVSLISHTPSVFLNPLSYPTS